MQNKTPYIVIAILFSVFNIIAFVVPTEKNAAFWIAYAFTIIAFVLQACVWYLSIGKKRNLKSKLLGSSVASISIVYLTIQFIAFLIFMFITSAPIWCAFLVCILILGISAVCMLTTNTSTEIIAATENKIDVKRQYIKDLQIYVEMLAESETDFQTKQKLNELAKKIRLSDPMSDALLADLEKEISAKVASIEHSSDKSATINEVERLLLKRNKKVMTLKR